MTSPSGKKTSSGRAEPPGRSGRVVLLATGGTIAGAACQTEPSGYRAAQLDVAALVAAVPPLQGLAADGRLEALQVAQVDSKDMGPAVWRALLAAVQDALARPEVAGVVVTHGTDTLEETAYLLHRLLAPAKPVVLTAAMRPATDPSADGPANLLDAVRVAAWPGARGVLAVLDQQVWAGAQVRKQHTWRMPAFGADAGPLAWVERALVRPLRAWPGPADEADAPVRRQVQMPREQSSGAPDDAADVDTQAARDDALKAALGAARDAALDPARTWPWVEIVHSHAGADGRVVRLLLQAGVQGLVVAGTGHGTLHQDLEAELLRAAAQGVPVVRASRVGQGAVWARDGDRLPAAGACSPAQARVELMIRLLAAGQTAG
ncbi:MAG: asparaginase [Burkholderiales bacterium]|nr:asparaginase [Burkholderiales bacterium]